MQVSMLAHTPHSPLLHQTGFTYLMDRWFMIHMFYISIFNLPHTSPPQLNQSWIIVPCGQTLTIPSLQMNLVLAYHLYITCQYIPYHRVLPDWSFPQISDFVRLPHLVFTLPHFASHPTVFACYIMPGEFVCSGCCLACHTKVLKRNIGRYYSDLKPNVPLRNCIGSLHSQDLWKWYHTNCGLVMCSSKSY